MTRALAAALCLAALPALAFEGVIETKMTATGMGKQTGGAAQISGNGTITIKGLNSRMEQSMNMPGITGPVKQVIIHRADEPNVTYMVSDANRSYRKLVSEKDEKTTDETSKWTVKRLGKETVAGRSTEHLQVLREGGDPMEVWIDRNLVSAGDLEKAIAQGDGRGGGWWTALKKEGVAGIPLKVVATNGRGEGAMTWEATSVKSTSVPDSAFRVPAGYSEQKVGSGPGALTPQQSQEMRNKMLERLSPEQRQKVEEMMKQHGGGGQ